MSDRDTDPYGIYASMKLVKMITDSGKNFDDWWGTGNPVAREEAASEEFETILLIARKIQPKFGGGKNGKV